MLRAAAASPAKLADFTAAKPCGQDTEQSQKCFARLQDKPVAG
jgi:hypothetical protein